MNKLIEWIKLNINHTWYNYATMLFCACLIYLANKFGGANFNSIIGIFGGIGANVILWISLVFGLEYFQLGIDRNIKKEIYDEHNIAAAIYELGIKIGLALIIAKGLL
jgi:hypothetical protein